MNAPTFKVHTLLLADGERLEDRIQFQLADMAAQPDLIRSFFRHPSVAYISDC